jgi:hypothetical protein
MVLQELKFSMSELVDPTKARRLGQMLGAQGLVLGRVSDVGGTLDLDARIIDIQTDVSLPGASASIVKDEAVSKMSSECASEGPEPQPPPPPPPLGSVVVEGIRFEVRSCEPSGTSATCRVVITNGSGQDQNVRFLPLGTRVIDNSGNEYHFVVWGSADYRIQRYRIGSKEANNLEWVQGGIPYTLVAGTPTTLVMTFGNISAEATRIALLEIKCSAGGGGHEFVVQLRNIPITPINWPKTNKP